jgi:hypothetical protein
VKGWEKIVCENGNQKKAGDAIHIPDKIELKSEIRHKEGHYILIKGQFIERI